MIKVINKILASRSKALVSFLKSKKEGLLYKHLINQRKGKGYGNCNRDSSKEDRRNIKRKKGCAAGGPGIPPGGGVRGAGPDLGSG
jgi:hypothetical protein